MHDRAPRPPESISVQSSEDSITFENLDKKTQRYLKRRSTLLGRATMALTLLSAPFLSVNTFWADVRDNQELAASSLPSVYEVLPDTLEDGLDTATYYAAGFDTRNGDVFAQQVGVPIQNTIGGSAYSIDYGNAPLDPNEIAHQVVEQAQDQQLDSISLAGNSLGGLISLQAAEEIIVNSDVNVDTIFLNATPDGAEGLKPTSQNDLYTIMNALDIPGMKYSTFARYAGTMTLESNRFLNEDGFDLFEFLEASGEVQAQIQEQRRPGMWLLVDQALAITESNAQESLRAIGEQRGQKQMPTIAYLRPVDADDDIVVDVIESSENICAYAKSAGLNCYVYFIEDAPHTSHLFNTAEIDITLARNRDEILDSVEQERSERAFIAQAHYYSE